LSLPAGGLHDLEEALESYRPPPSCPAQGCVHWKAKNFCQKFLKTRGSSSTIKTKAGFGEIMQIIYTSFPLIIVE
jgi:hypothetical protein